MRPPFRRYSLLAMWRQARRGHAGSPLAWRAARLQDAYDIVIVGGGPAALALAAALARHHAPRRVAVLAGGPLTGGPGGGAAVRRVGPGAAAAMVVLAQAQRLFPALPRQLNFNLGLSRRGRLDLAFGKSALDELERTAAIARDLGIAAWLVPPREARVLAPPIGADAALPSALSGALWQPAAGLVNADALVWGFARLAAAYGVDIIETETADALAWRGGALAGVRVGERTVGAETVVLASAAALHLLADVDPPTPVVAAPRRLIVCEPVRPRLDVMIGGGGLGGTVRQDRRGALLFDTEDEGPLAWRGLGAAAARLTAHLPGLADLRAVRTETWTEAATAEGTPLVGPCTVPGLWACLGWDADEAAAAPAVGRALAGSIAANRLDPLIAALAPARTAARDALAGPLGAAS